MVKKIPISFNTEDLKIIAQLEDLMNIKDTYGALPKSLKFGIRLALSCIKNPQKVYTDLNDSNIDIYFQTVQRSEIKERKLNLAKKLNNQAEKV
jgi:hypothetical protein